MLKNLKQNIAQVIHIAHNARFDTSNYDVQGPLPTGKSKKVIGLMKDKLGGRIMNEFVALRPKMYT